MAKTKKQKKEGGVNKKLGAIFRQIFQQKKEIRDIEDVTFEKIKEKSKIKK